LVFYATSDTILLDAMNKKNSSTGFRGPQRCVCGNCATCVDNDRWERIFQQKYGQQEREYYAATREPRSSGVSARAFADASIYACAEEREICAKPSPKVSNTDLFYNLLRKARHNDTAA
jgi:hypothetical protein